MSTAIGIRFPSGRYHALPWDRHVNEADVEWPPSPLRLLRALIAVWHRKADRERFPEEQLRNLIHALASDRPVYRLPEATLSHVRHFMPVRSGRSEKKTLIFDAFLRLSREDELLVVWPDVVLDETQRMLLEHLLERLGYLGRAESWAECRLLDTWSSLPDCGPESSLAHWATGTLDGLEPVELPVPLGPEAYTDWQVERIESLGLEKPRLKRDRQLRSTLPDDLVDALRLETADVRAAGWSRMPGTDSVTYLRPEGCFTPVRTEKQRHRGHRDTTTTVRLALVRCRDGEGRLGMPLPRIEDAVRIGEIIRQAAMRKANDPPPALLSGHEVPGDKPHQHAFYLPEDERDPGAGQGDGRIDHAIVHAPGGLGEEALRALGRIDRIWLREGQEWSVLLESFGAGREYLDHPYLAEARVWCSVTPYLHPWHRKRSFTVEDQIRKELALREPRLPAPRLEPLETVKAGSADRRPVQFHRFRNRRGLTQPDTRGSFWQLTFPEPVAGPVALGFGCHYGLGLFRAKDANT